MAFERDKIAYQLIEAATAMGLSRSKIYEEIKEGRLRSITAGGRRLILRADMDAYFAACPVGPISEVTK